MAQEGQAASERTPVKVPADLLDADMLYQRDAVLHSGRASCAELRPERRRVLHALIAGRDGEVVADPMSRGVDVLADAAASLVVDRAVADVEPPRIVVVEGGGARPGAADGFLGLEGLPGDENVPGDRGLARRWIPEEASSDLVSAEAGLLRTTASYLDRDVSQLDLHGARMGLRGRLDRVNSARMILVNVVAADSGQDAVGLQVGRLAELCRFGEDLEERLLVASSSLRRIDAALDPIRAYELWLAVHVYECAWLALAERGEVTVDLRLVEHVSPDGLAVPMADNRPIDLLGILGADDVAYDAVRPLVSRASRTFAAEAVDTPAPGSALAFAASACRWDFSAGASR